MAGTEIQDQIERFLAGDSFAVVGASPNRAKFGNKVFRAYLQQNRRVFPVNPNETEVEGHRTYPDLASLPERVHGISIITQPAVTEEIVTQAIALDIEHIWMQPGAENADAVERAEQAGVNVISGGLCILVELRFRDR